MEDIKSNGPKPHNLTNLVVFFQLLIPTPRKVIQLSEILRGGNVFKCEAKLEFSDGREGGVQIWELEPKTLDRMGNFWDQAFQIYQTLIEIK